MEYFPAREPIFVFSDPRGNLIATLGVGMILSALNVSLPGFSIHNSISCPVLAICYTGYLSGKHDTRTMALSDKSKPHGRSHLGFPFLAVKYAHPLE